MIGIGDIVLYEGAHYQVVDFMKCWVFGSDETAHEKRALLQDIPATCERLVPVDDVVRVRSH